MELVVDFHLKSLSNSNNKEEEYKMENYKKESRNLADNLLCPLYDKQPFCFNPQEINKKMVKTIDEWNGICEELKYYPIFLIYLSHDIDENVIRENEDQFDWNFLSSCQSGFSEEFLNEYKEKLNINTITFRFQLSKDFIRENIEILNWRTISYTQSLSEEFIDEFEDRIDWEYLSMNSYLTKDMIRKYKDKLNWSHICAKQNLGPEFMEEMEEYLDWEIVSMFQEMPYSFIMKYKDKLNMENILRYHYLVFPEEELKKLKEEYGKHDETEVK